MNDISEEDVYEINKIIKTSNLCQEIVPSYYELKSGTTIEDIELYAQKHGWKMQETNFKEERSTHIENEAHFSTRGGGKF